MRAPPAFPEKAKPPGIAAGMSVQEAFRAIACACLFHLLANAPLLPARDPEAVHQMRVALRRLRAALSLFRDAVADGEAGTVKAELRALAADFGEARDLDVFIEKTLGPACAERPDDAGLADLARVYAGRRDAAYDKAVEAVSSGRLGRAVLKTLAWTEAGSWLAGEDNARLRAAPVEAFAARELARRARRVRGKAARLAELEPAARHRVRIAVKKLRYAAEFFAPLWPGKGRARRAKAFRAALVDLQDRLGDLNDIAVAAALAGNGADPATREAERLLAERRASRLDEHLGAARRAFRDFADAEPFWR
ncbi:MAG TPA: CHAD domain-containing protein [Beijerinckiaceae bacterium]